MVVVRTEESKRTTTRGGALNGGASWCADADSGADSGRAAGRASPAAGATACAHVCDATGIGDA